MGHGFGRRLQSAVMSHDMRAVIYARLSRKTDKNEANLATQLERCREWAAVHGWTVVAEFTDYGESAFDRDSMEDRPGFGQLLGLIRDKQVDAVLAWRTDRMFRDPIEQALFYRECVRCKVKTVATVQEGERNPNDPGDEMVSTIVTAVTRYESNAKRQRILAKHRQIAEQGRFSGGGQRAFGYEPDFKTVVPHEAEAIRWAAKHILDGGTLTSVVRHFEATGVKAMRDTPWKLAQVRRFLTGARWAGLREHKGEIVAQAEWPAILTLDELTKLRAILLDPERFTGKNGSQFYLLSRGVAVCGQCGGKLVGRAHSRGYRRYICPKGPGHSGCGGIARLADRIEENVIERMFAAIDEGMVANAEPAMPPTDTGRTIEQLKDALNSLAQDHYVHGIIRREEYLSARQPLADQLQALESRLSSPAPSQTSLAGLRSNWATMANEDKRAVVRRLIEAVVVHQTKLRGSNKFDPSLIEIRWRA